ncbi:MAG: hypothetical protein ACD_60C00027G0006 [uncultured bacterium]|nr:MAG: hypothetical protein ACD_60C00027G0006 [uncultured bacterium]
MLIKKILKESPYFMLGVLIIFFLCTHKPNVGYDTPSYIYFSESRPLFYPLFILLFRWGGIYQFTLIMWVQGILLFIALLYARYWLRKNLKIFDFSIFLVFLWVLITISFHYQIAFIQSEGLSFPLFVFVFFLLIECFQKFNLKKISYLSFLVSILILVRLQFYYFYIIFGLLCLWYLWQHVPFKALILGAAILFGSAGVTILIDHGYHYFKHGFFSSAPYAGILTLVQGIYLADSNAAHYFKDPIEKAYVQQMINQRDAQHLNRDASLIITLKPLYFEYAYQSYRRNFLAIQEMIENILQAKNETFHSKLESNVLAIDIGKTLIFYESERNILFFLWKFIECMGGIPGFLFFFILLLSWFFKMTKNKIMEPDFSSLFVAIATIITFLNAAIIALCNPDLPPYFCYSQFILYCLAAFLASQIFSKNSPSELPKKSSVLEREIKYDVV